MKKIDWDFIWVLIFVAYAAFSTFAFVMGLWELYA
jgi:hypothetical protein